MSVALRKPMTREEFLAWEEQQELRWEFDGFAPVAMTGGTAAHAAIQGNVIVALATRLRGKPCRAFTSHLKMAVGRSIRYPDAFVVCSPVSPNDTVVSEPVVVFEILGPDTAFIDRTAKNDEYAATPSIRRYVMLEQDVAAATVFAREGTRWVATYMHAGEILEMPEIDIEIPLAELYEGVSFPEAPSDAAAQA